MPLLDAAPAPVALDANGDPVSGAKLTVYTAGTTTTVTIYSDSALTTPIATPYAANSNGRWATDIYVAAGSYKIDVTDTSDASLPGYPVDNVYVDETSVSLSTLLGTYRFGTITPVPTDLTGDLWTVTSLADITVRARTYDATTQLFDQPYVAEFAGSSSVANQRVTSDRLAVATPGQEWEFTADIYATSSPTEDFLVSIVWLDASGVVLSRTTATTANAGITSGQTLQVAAAGVAPSSTAGVAVEIERTATGTTGTWYAAPLGLRRANADIGLADIDPAIRSGADATLITGTAGTDGNVAQWNADGDLVDGPDVLDEDDMSSDSATALATQQSIKAYVDSAASAWTEASPVSQATTSGTAFDWTGLPAGIRQIRMGFDETALSGSDNFLIQIGDSGGLETTGYASGGGTRGGESSSTAGFIMFRANANYLTRGFSDLHRLTGNVWTFSYSHDTDSLPSTGGGIKTLSGELDRIRLTRTGSNTFDNGTIYLNYA